MNSEELNAMNDLEAVGEEGQVSLAIPTRLKEAECTSTTSTDEREEEE